MLPLLVKLNCLSIRTETKPYVLNAQQNLRKQGIASVNPIASAYADDIISVIGIDMGKRDPVKQVENIINVYKRFSKVSGLSNNDAKTVYGLTINEDDVRGKRIMELLIDKFDAGRENFRFNGQEIKLLGDIIVIGRDETELVISEGKWVCVPSSNMKARINKISDILDR